MIEWTGNIQVVTMNQCNECATCTSNPPNEYGNAYCPKHDTLKELQATR